jgi:hypothetical protein
MQKLDLERPVQKSPNVLLWVLVFAFVGYVAVDNGWVNIDWSRQERDKEEQVEPQPVDPVVKGDVLVAVLEKRATTVEQELVLRAKDEFVEKYKLAGFRTLDNDDHPTVDPFLKYAEMKRVDVAAGGVFLVRDKKIVKCAPFPKDKAALEGFLK